MNAVSGSDAQLGDIIHLTAWGACALLLVIVLFVAALILFFITRHIRRKRNSELRSQLADLDIELEENKYGLLDGTGELNGRKVKVMHMRDVWSPEREVVFRLEHRVQSLRGEQGYKDCLFTKNFASMSVHGWQKDAGEVIASMLEVVGEVEDDPSLLENDEKGTGDQPPPDDPAHPPNP